jgi:tRNA (guanine37-N1)-methyltransferase
MNFHIMTLFPEMVMQGLNTSIIGRAMEKGIINIEAVNIRDFAFNKHNKVDDYIYGGGAGMLMQAEPVWLCYKHITSSIEDKEKNGSGISAGRSPRVVYLTPQGEVFSQSKAMELAAEEDLILLCGHYEGIDERVLEEIVTDNISIGDYVLTGGELPAMIIVDAVSRLIPGVLNNDVSAEFESFHEGLLEYPQYSRPEVWHDKRVPEVLLSGHHANVDRWRHEQAVLRTKERRPDLYDIYRERSETVR